MTWAAGTGRSAAPARVVPGGDRLAGAFVTLYRDGELRGCIGYLEADRPLADVVAEMAVAAASDDPRFPPITADETGALDIEISVLTPCVRARPEDVVLGRDGVMVRRGTRQGVLLPRVAGDHGWSRDTLLDMVCRKAGLPANAWQDGRTALFTFQAQVIAADQA